MKNDPSELRRMAAKLSGVERLLFDMRRAIRKSAPKYDLGALVVIERGIAAEARKLDAAALFIEQETPELLAAMKRREMAAMASAYEDASRN